MFRGSFGSKAAAIKIFFPTADSRRLDRELELLKQLDCKYLVSVLDTSQVQLSGHSYPIVAYQYYAGGDLQHFLAPTSPPLAVRQLLQIGRCVSVAVTHLWRQRIVHRDIKPANIVRSGQSEFVLVDVGLARHLDLSDITIPGGAPGTRGYMSPEQARGRRSLTVSSDAFSLGVTLYTLAAKEHPFGGAQHLVGTHAPKPIQDLRPDLSTGFATMIHKMMATIPSKRPRLNADDFEILMESG